MNSFVIDNLSGLYMALAEVKVAEVTHTKLKRRHSRLRTACPRCIGGHVYREDRDLVCWNCGWRYVSRSEMEMMTYLLSYKDKSRREPQMPGTKVKFRSNGGQGF